MSMTINELEEIRIEKNLDSISFFLDDDINIVTCFISDKMISIRIPRIFFWESFHSRIFLEQAIDEKLKELSNDI